MSAGHRPGEFGIVRETGFGEIMTRRLDFRSNKLRPDHHAAAIISDGCRKERRHAD